MKLRMAPPDVKGRALHVAFPMALSSKLRAEAARRGVTAGVLVGATVKKMVEDSLLDAMLDGQSLQDLAPGHALLVNGLTRCQGAVLYLMAGRCDRFGIVRASAKRLALGIPGGNSAKVWTALAALERGLLIARAERGGGGERPWGITEDGWRVALTLGVVRER